MKLVHTQITPLIKSNLHIEMRRQPFMFSPYHDKPTYHTHPEYELLYILEGYGKKIIGNEITPFCKGDMVFLGSNVPHIWLSDASFYERDAQREACAIVVYINPVIFEQMFEMLDEFDDIKNMLDEASRGFEVLGQTKKCIASNLQDLFNASGYKKFEGVLNILHTLATSVEKAHITENVFSISTGTNTDKLVTVLKYIQENLSEDIPLCKLADLAYMTESSFCRFFKSRMGINLSQYLTEERMERARKLLMELDKPVYEIAGLCGYNSDSHFCKVFKAHSGISPYQYKSRVKRITMLKNV